MFRTNITAQLFVVFLISFSNIAYAEDCSPWVAKAISIQGNVERRSDSDHSSVQWLPIKRDDVMCAGEMIRVKQNSRAALILKNDTILRLNQNTTITLSSLSEDQSHWINLEQGIAHFIARIKQSFKVITPFVNAAVEGTEFVVSVNETQTEVTVFEGKVNVKNKLGEVKLTTGQTATTTAKSIPALVIKIKPRDAVQWSLYYPAIINYDSTEYQDFDPDSKIIIERSIAAARDGQYTTALEQINLIREIENNTTLLIYRAALYLSVGIIKKAKQDIQLVVKTQPDNAQAIALQAIFAIVQNEKTKALSLAEHAVTIDPNSASTALALSYVHQSLFDIDAALKVNKAIIPTNKNNALLWSRLSELNLMVGELDEALIAAKKANNLNPNIARTHSALGFAYLTRIEVKNAIQSFMDAIVLDDSDPLSRLGLGLAIIRQGNLEEGRQQIEFAATLDPNNALIRSYLGKAYYEEKRDKLASAQFTMAKEIDPKDPTAYFYDAIRLQSINQPIKALIELENSIKLNNNRAISRSKLKLDEDNAARTASLARIYQELGFNIQAQNEAFVALNKNYSSNSAHHFLTEAYQNKPRHEIARVSEALQAQLLSPINIRPTTPSLSDINLGTISNAGPSQAGFSEYNSLFTRNSNQFDFTAITGNHQTSGYEMTYSAIHENTVMSIGKYRYQTDGFRKNNDLKQDILNFFVQSDFSPKHSIQFEFKNNEKENGDLVQKFDPTNFSTTKRETDNDASSRLGYKWNAGIKSDLIISAIYNEIDFSKTNRVLASLTGAPGGLPLYTVSSSDLHINSTNSEAQYLHSNSNNNLVIGIGNSDQTDSEKTNFQFTTEDNTVLAEFPKNGTTKRSHFNSYLYSYYYPSMTSRVTMGISNDNFNRKGYSTNQWNPKFGYNHDFSRNASFHIAAFRTLKRTLVSNQTIEPTQIEGVNQFFDDPTATDTKNYAISLKYNFSNTLFSRINLHKRDLDIPIINNNTTINENQIEHYYNANLHWIINSNYSSGIEYSLVEFKKEDSPILSTSHPNYLRTQKIPLFMTYHSSIGFYTRLSAIHYYQKLSQPSGSFSSRTFTYDNDKFWIWNLNVGYRLAKRKGNFSVVVNNLLDKNFKYFNSKFRTDVALPPELSHDRSITFKINLNIN